MILKTGKCKLTQPTFFRIHTFGAGCELYFGRNTNFDYTYNEHSVTVSKPGIDLTIPKESFESKFTIIVKIGAAND